MYILCEVVIPENYESWFVGMSVRENTLSEEEITYQERIQNLHHLEI